jgi:hypothetical protein
MVAEVVLVAALNDSPVGSVPVSVTVGAGEPVVVTVYVPATPVLNVAVDALVIVGASALVSVNDWVVVPLAFVAVSVIG